MSDQDKSEPRTHDLTSALLPPKHTQQEVYPATTTKFADPVPGDR